VLVVIQDDDVIKLLELVSGFLASFRFDSRAGHP
jgi:hypothetical protein